MDNFIKFLFGSNRRISRVVRYSTRPRTVDEYVATHSYYVALYGLLISKMLIEKGVKVDIESVMTRALVHDLDESVSGDIIRIFREKLSDELEVLCGEVMQGILKGLSSKITEYLMNHWKNKFEGIEGQIVRLCDNISGWAYCEEQIQMGNKIFIPISEDYLKRVLTDTFNMGLEELNQQFKEYDREKISYDNK
jgi:5'-deoxynucleotidase YfbR-like HD superfamily hydrolase